MRATKLSLLWSLISLLFLTSHFLQGQDTAKSLPQNDFSEIQFENDFSKVPAILVDKVGDSSLYFGRKLCLTTNDMRPTQNLPAKFPSSIQIVDAENPWPPVWFVSSSLEGLYNYFMDVNFQKKGRLTTVSFEKKDLNQRSYYFLNDSMQILKKFSGHDNFVDFHDLQVDSKGSVLYATRGVKIMDVSDLSGNEMDTAVSVTGTVINIMSPDNQVIFSWSALDHMDIREMYYELNQDPYVGAGAGNVDFSHVNAIRWAADGNILYTFRNIGVGKIHVKTGNIIWRFGGKNSDFNLSMDGNFHLPKDFSQLSNFNQYSFYAYKGVPGTGGNGDNIPGEAIGLVFQIDSAGSYKRLRAFEPKPAMLSLSLGNFEVYSDGTALINYGMVTTLFNDSPEFAHYIDSGDNIVAKYKSQSFQAIYRVREHPLAVERPSISNSINGRLTANNDKAKWYKVDSLGVSTFKAKGSFYKPRESGNYVVTVPFGIGELVSTVKTYTVKDKSSGN